MTQRSLRRVPIAAAAAAVMVALIDVAGSAGWSSATRMLSIQPEVGARKLAHDVVVRLPSFSHRARRLAVRDLGTAPRQLVVAALGRVGRQQTLWMPADASGFTHLSHAALLGDRPTEALRRLEEALDRDPLSPSLRRLRALVLLYLGVLDEALNDLAVAFALAPQLQSPAVELTPEDERIVRQRGLEMRGSFYPRRRVEAALALARAVRGDGDLERARLILAEYDGHPEAELTQASWELEAGHPHRALEILGDLIDGARTPRRLRARAWSLVAIAEDTVGDRDRALAAARSAIELDASSPAPYVTLAGLAQRRGDLEEALDHLRRAWGMAPTDAGLLERIAAVAWRAGRPGDARLALERAIEIEPEEPRLVVGLARLELETGNYAEAAVALSRGLDRFPADADLLRLAEQLRREIEAR